MGEGLQERGGGGVRDGTARGVAVGEGDDGDGGERERLQPMTV